VIITRVIFLIIGLICIIVGYFYKKETHQKMIFKGGTTATLDESLSKTILGGIIEFVLKKLPWWGIRLLWILFGISIIVFAFMIKP